LLKRIKIDRVAAAADNDYIIMTLRETFGATKQLTSVSNSKEDNPWIIQYFREIFNVK
jgi:hypothetical protein